MSAERGPFQYSAEVWGLIDTDGPAVEGNIQSTSGRVATPKAYIGGGDPGQVLFAGPSPYVLAPLEIETPDGPGTRTERLWLQNSDGTYFPAFPSAAGGAYWPFQLHEDGSIEWFFHPTVWVGGSPTPTDLDGDGVPDFGPQEPESIIIQAFLVPPAKELKEPWTIHLRDKPKGTDIDGISWSGDTEKIKVEWTYDELREFFGRNPNIRQASMDLHYGLCNTNKIELVFLARSTEEPDPNNPKQCTTETSSFPIYFGAPRLDFEVTEVQFQTSQSDGGPYRVYDYINNVAPPEDSPHWSRDVSADTADLIPAVFKVGSQVRPTVTFQIEKPPHLAEPFDIKVSAEAELVGTTDRVDLGSQTISNAEIQSVGITKEFGGIPLGEQIDRTKVKLHFTLEYRVEEEGGKTGVYSEDAISPEQAGSHILYTILGDPLSGRTPTSRTEYLWYHIDSFENDQPNDLTPLSPLDIANQIMRGRSTPEAAAAALAANLFQNRTWTQDSSLLRETGEGRDFPFIEALVSFELAREDFQAVGASILRHAGIEAYLQVIEPPNGLSRSSNETDKDNFVWTTYIKMARANAPVTWFPPDTLTDFVDSVEDLDQERAASFIEMIGEAVARRLSGSSTPPSPEDLEILKNASAAEMVNLGPHGEERFSTVWVQHRLSSYPIVMLMTSSGPKYQDLCSRFDSANVNKDNPLDILNGFNRGQHPPQEPNSLFKRLQSFGFTSNFLAPISGPSPEYTIGVLPPEGSPPMESDGAPLDLPSFLTSHLQRNNLLPGPENHGFNNYGASSIEPVTLPFQLTREGVGDE